MAENIGVRKDIGTKLRCLFKIQHQSIWIVLLLPRSLLLYEKCLLRLTKHKTTLGGRSFSFSGPKTWNRLPQYIREEENLDNFTTLIEIVPPLSVCEGV